MTDDTDTDNYNENALLYNNHQVNYPQHLKRRYWIMLSHEGRHVIRDAPDGPAPCPWGHEECIAAMEGE